MSDLTEWIKKGYSNGKTKEELNKLLLNAGWDITAVNKAFEQIDIEQQLLADRFIKNSYSNTPRPTELPIMENDTQEVKEPKKSIFKNPFIPKESSKVYKCPKCNTEMVTEDVKDFIVKELEALNNG